MTRTITMSWYDRELGMLLPQRTLLARGWTKKAIRERLGEPDCFGQNPRGGARVLLYSEARVRRAKLHLVSDVG
jgi:hypothetical protein